AGVDRALSHVTGHGRPSRPQLRPPRRCKKGRRRRPYTPHHPEARKPSPQNHRRRRRGRDHRRDRRADAGGTRGVVVMKWFAGAILLLVIAILFGFDLLAYAVYVL